MFRTGVFSGETGKRGGSGESERCVRAFGSLTTFGKH